MVPRTIAYLVLAPDIGYRGMFFNYAEMRCVVKDLNDNGYGPAVVKELIERPTNEEKQHEPNNSVDCHRDEGRAPSDGTADEHALQHL